MQGIIAHKRRSALLATAALGGLMASPVFAQDSTSGAAAPLPVPTAQADAATSTAGGSQTAAGAPAATSDIIVTARRSNEKLQNVPVAVSVIAPATLNAKGTYSPVDLTASVPSLTVNSTVGDRNNLTYTIRGQGFAYGTLFPAVITYFNEVPITQLTAGQFFDLANVQVLRGPQGVNFGRVTDGGNVLVTAQEPKDEFGGYAQLKLGDYNLKVFDGAINVPIVSDRILLRGAAEIGRRRGFTENVYNGEHLDGERYESYRLGLKINVTDTLTNTTTVAYQRTHDNGTSTVFDTINVPTLTRAYATTGLFPGVYGINANGDVVPNAPGLTPLTAATFVASRQAFLAEQQALGPRKIFQTTPTYNRRKNLYVVNRTQADLSDNIQLTNIFGYVDVKEDLATNFGGSTGAALEGCERACGTGDDALFNSQKQLSEELRLAGKLIDDRLTWAVGGYADRQTPGGRSVENDLFVTSILEQDVIQYAKTTSRAGYGSFEYDFGDAVPGLKVNGGVRYTHDTVDSQNVTYARPLDAPGAQQTLAAVLPFVLEAQGIDPATAAFLAPNIAAATFQPIPHGQCTSYGTLNGFPSLLGAVDCRETKGSFNATTWQGGISYKRGSSPLLYAKVSKGYRPGGVNSSVAVTADPTYRPETDVSVELGIKSEFHLGGAVVRANLAAYHDRYKDIQKTVSLPVSGNGTLVSLVSNVAAATIQGVEFEGAVIPIAGLSLGGNFSHTDAKYDHDKPYDPRSCDPTATALSGFCPFNRFGFVPKYQYTLTADYTLPLDENVGKVSIGAQYYHQSSMSLSESSLLNPGSIERPYGYLNLNLTWASVLDRPFDIGFFVTNVTNKLYRIATQDLSQSSSVGISSSTYAPPRMFGFSLKYRFGSDAL